MAHTTMPPPQAPRIHTPTRTRTFLDAARERFLADPDHATYRAVADTGPLSEVRIDSITNTDLDRRVRALAVELRDRTRVGDRVLILSGPGLDYVTAFYACLYAGVIAVPSYPPTSLTTQRMNRLRSVAEHCAAAAVISDAEGDADGTWLSDALPHLPRHSPRADLSRADEWRRPPVIGEDVAFLQYSSGSTGSPKGVMVSHHNLLAHTQVLANRFLDGPDSRWESVTWLPPYHDMGLIGALLTMPLAGSSVTMMTPTAFLKRPLRWLQVASAIHARLMGAPDFAYDLCVRKATPEAMEQLDLSSVDVAFSGAEPVRSATLDRFTRTFAPVGFRAGSWMPCYGLAEGTLAVTAAQKSHARTLDVSTSGIAAGVCRPATDKADLRRLVSCGPVIDGVRVRIVDPGGTNEVDEGDVGEIVIDGPSVTSGYFRSPDLTQASRMRFPDEPDTDWLRTGDLGFLQNHELFVIGRSKDLIIVNGTNHHPHDLEDSAAASHPAIRGGGVAAFAHGADDAEVALIVEIAARTKEEEAQDVAAAVRRALAHEHGVVPSLVTLTMPGTVLKTSSGKVQRAACRAALEHGDLAPRTRWTFDGTEATDGDPR